MSQPFEGISSTDKQKYIEQAEYLLSRGYPLPTHDPVELAEKIYNAKKNTKEVSSC